MLGGNLSDDSLSSESWYSADGISWFEAAALDRGFRNHASVIYDGRIIVRGRLFENVGGVMTSCGGFYR